MDGTISHYYWNGFSKCTLRVNEKIYLFISGVPYQITAQNISLIQFLTSYSKFHTCYGKFDQVLEKNNYNFS